ncbi:FKBP-type peptidyl-prolyl cis-trans isomerase [Terrimonas rubra]|uniref:peptidylprolyl isomerase n=1 Tax=Terrimonas rubra TaxID=1035890 RepID=A0ABW6A8W1_9BACT
MQKLRLGGLVLLTGIMMVACNSVSYKKTAGGLLYKIFPSDSKDSLIKVGNTVKLDIDIKLNDSVLQTTYGKMPAFIPAQEPNPQNGLDPFSIFTLMKTGDSAVVVILADSLLNKPGVQLPPGAKKGDRFMFYMRIKQVFTSDSLAQADFTKEQALDAPRQQKEMEEQRAKMIKEQQEQQKKEDAELEKSGKKAELDAVVKNLLASKNITTTKTPLGSYVRIDNPGTGDAVVAGKIATVKYSGKLLLTDSVFQASTVDFTIGANGLIRGMEDGLLLFKKGGKGTIYIPGHLAYGANPPAGSPFKPFDALAFDVEIVDVKEKPATPDHQAH